MDIIYSISDLIGITKSITECFRVQDYFQGNKYMHIFVTKINDMLTNNNVFNKNEFNDIVATLEKLFNAQQNEDYILLADLLDMSIVPTLQNVLTEIILSNDVLADVNFLSENLSALRHKNYSQLADKILRTSKKLSALKEYTVECTNTGYPTLKYSCDDFSCYYHSNVSPADEGKAFAKYYVKENCYNYAILGFGFGYHIREFLNLDRRFVVNAIETNIEVLTLAFLYCDLRDIISNDRFKLSFCDEMDIVRQISVDENVTFIIHNPSLRTLKIDLLRDELHKYFINLSSMYSQKKYLDWNFYYNIRQGDEPAHNIMSRFTDKSVIYIGGGPSLEYYLDYISENKSSKIIICASTVYRKLAEHSITPDYVVMIDAQDNMINHFKNASTASTSLIYLSTSCSDAVEMFQGDRYILFQNGYDKAEAYASENHLSLVETGGSVSTTIIDYLIQCRCRELTSIGLDLAYTDNKSHSFGIGKASCSDNMFSVKSVSGGIVPTTSVLNLYRLWIEERIKNVTDIKFINLSHGAYIKGMENIS